MSEQLFSYSQLFDFTKTILHKIGCSENDSEIAARVLLSADLRGVDSHGVARLSGYVRLWEVKRINTNPLIKISSVDSDNFVFISAIASLLNCIW